MPNVSGVWVLKMRIGCKFKNRRPKPVPNGEGTGMEQGDKTEYGTSRLDNLPDVLTPRQVCEVLQFSSRPDRILREKLAPAGLPVLRVGGRLRVFKSDLIAWLHGLKAECGSAATESLQRYRR